MIYYEKHTRRCLTSLLLFLRLGGSPALRAPASSATSVIIFIDIPAEFWIISPRFLCLLLLLLSHRCPSSSSNIFFSFFFLPIYKVTERISFFLLLLLLLFLRTKPRYYLCGLFFDFHNSLPFLFLFLCVWASFEF